MRCVSPAALLLSSHPTPPPGKPPAPKGLGAKNRRHAYKFPGFWPVISSVLLSVAVVVFFLGTLAALAVNEVNTVTTVNGLTCYGWFPKCDRDLCYEYAAPSVRELPRAVAAAPAPHSHPPSPPP